MLALRSILRNSGFNPRRLFFAAKDWMRYCADRKAFQSLDVGAVIPWGNELPILGEWREESGDLGAYFFQDQLVARWVFEAKPIRHVDVGSRLDGFVGMLSVFREVEVLDIRPMSCSVMNIKFQQMDLMKPLNSQWLDAVDSLSCLHTIEHFGLGRYGDELDPLGHEKGLQQLKQMVSVGGLLYLSTPLGPSRIEFNAHRVFSTKIILEWFSHGWQIERLAVIDDSNCLHEIVNCNGDEMNLDFGCNLGVAIIAARRLF